jgi:hypothetical protein
VKNVLTTIPKGRFPSWEVAERTLMRCDGETEWNGGQPWFWLVNCHALPKQSGVGAVCYMVYDGLVRGYMDIVDTDVTENWRSRHGIGKRRNTSSLILANWHPLHEEVGQRGFQGYRYTELRP